MTSLVKGPDFAVLPKRQCEISFVIEGGDGNLAKVSLIFEAVEAFKCTYMTSLSADMINAAYGKLVDVGTSQWLLESRQRNTEYAAKTKRSSPDLKHLMICFDDGPCYEFICVGCRTAA